MDPTPLVDQARLALGEVQRDPAAALTTASALAERARDQGDHAAEAVARRAVGLALVHRQELPRAQQELRRAIALGDRAARPSLAAEARMTYAFALNRAGSPRRALREITAALDDLDPLRRAEGLVQRAGILQQAGQIEAALLDYRTALPVLRRSGDQVWLQRALLNRGVLYAFAHQYPAALQDLTEAGRLCDELGLQLPRAFVHENLLLVHRRRGDVPAALQHLRAAERIYTELGMPVGSLLMERSEVLLSVGLVEEADEAATEAVAAFRHPGGHVHLPEARVLAGRTATLVGDRSRAEEQMRRAVRELDRQGRHDWSALARGARLLFRLESGQGEAAGVHAVRTVLERAETYGWRATAGNLRLAAGERWLASDVAARRDEGRLLLGELAGKRRGTVAERLRACYAEAVLRRADGRRVASSAAARRGLELLEEQRGSVQATDVRAGMSRLGRDLAQLGLRNSLESGRAATVLEWAERGRARHLARREARPPQDDELAHLLAELRAVTAEQLQRQAGGADTTALDARQRVLERAARDAGRHGHHLDDAAPGTAPSTAPSTAADERAIIAAASIPALQSALSANGAVLLEFVELDEQLWVVVVTAAGRARLVSLGPVSAVLDQVRWLPFGLTRLAASSSRPASVAAALALLRRTAARLDAALLQPLRAELAASGPVVLVPTGVLQSLPWSLLPSLHEHPVTVAPSAGLWLAAAQHRNRPGPVRVVAGPDLAGADREAYEVAAVHGVRELRGSAASAAAVLEHVSGAGLLHVAAHGLLRADNPLFSSIRMADGPLTVYELERLRHPVDTVVLAACESGRDTVLAGDETIGLSAAFLGQGTRQVIASVVVLPDLSAVEVMTRLHRSLAERTDVAQALHRLQRDADPADSTAYAAAAGLVCLGHGFAPAALSGITDPS